MLKKIYDMGPGVSIIVLGSRGSSRVHCCPWISWIVTCSLLSLDLVDCHLFIVVLGSRGLSLVHCCPWISWIVTCSLLSLDLGDCHLFIVVFGSGGLIPVHFVSFSVLTEQNVLKILSRQIVINLHNTIPILMHEMYISTNQVSSVMLMPKN
jgi:hypothetical protein